MATTTAEMQDLQEVNRGPDKDLATQGPSEQGGALGLTKGGSLPSLKEILAQPAVKKATPGIMIAILMVFFVASYLAMQDPVYRPIFPGMTDADRQVASEALKEGGFSPRVNRSSGQLEVDAANYHEARIYLASKGLPSEGAASGFEALSGSASITTSQFMEQANYAAAVEQELAKSIIRISSIKHARVHLALPKQSVFVRDRTPPKASVVVTRFAGRNIDRDQVNAIINLVAASIQFFQI